MSSFSSIKTGTPFYDQAFPEEQVMIIGDVQQEKCVEDITGVERYTGRTAHEGTQKHIVLQPEHFKEDIDLVREFNKRMGMYVPPKESLLYVPFDPEVHLDFTSAVLEHYCTSETFRRICSTRSKIIPFISSKKLEQFAQMSEVPLLNSAAAAEQWNNKVNFMEMASKKQGAMNRYSCFTEEDIQEAVKALLRTFDTAVVRASRAASGMGMYKVTSPDQLSNVFEDSCIQQSLDPCISCNEEHGRISAGVDVAGWIGTKKGIPRSEQEVIASPSMTAWIGPDGRNVFLEGTVQVLNESDTNVEHMGNVSPIPAIWCHEFTRKMQNLFQDMYPEMRRSRAYGFHGFDAVHHMQGTNLVEDNYRMNGSMPGRLLSLASGIDSRTLQYVGNIPMQGMSNTEFLAKLEREFPVAGKREQVRIGIYNLIEKEGKAQGVIATSSLQQLLEILDHMLIPTADLRKLQEEYAL